MKLMAVDIHHYFADLLTGNSNSKHNTKKLKTN